MNQKWNHENSPLVKRKNSLLEKEKAGTISNSEKIQLNNIQIEYCKDMIRANKGNKEFAKIVFEEILKFQRNNEKLTREISQKVISTKRRKKPMIRKGPKK